MWRGRFGVAWPNIGVSSAHEPRGRRVVTKPELTDDIKTRAAWLYYMEDMTQDQIAAELGLTRVRVLKLLLAARQSGMVQIRVTARLSHCVELERAIEKKWGVERVIVIPKPLDTAKTSALIGVTLGAYIADQLTDNMTIGLGWGETLSACLPALGAPSVTGVKIVSLLGGLSKVSAYNPSEFAWRFADKIGAECYLMAAPIFAPTKAIRDGLMDHPGIQEVCQRAEHLDLAIVSVGHLGPGSTLSGFEILDRPSLDAIQHAGAVGDLFCRFIDAEGQPIDHPINERVIAVDNTLVRNARCTVLASGGKQKASGVAAALKALSPKVLITDETVAEYLMASASPVSVA